MNSVSSFLLRDLTQEQRSWAFVLGRVVLLVLSASLPLTIIYRIFFHPLRHIPGPFAARFTEVWRTWRYARGNWHEDILNLHRQYGPVVRLSPNEVSIVDKDGLTSVFGHGKVRQFSQSQWIDLRG
jgi:hypothetical protein